MYLPKIFQVAAGVLYTKKSMEKEPSYEDWINSISTLITQMLLIGTLIGCRTAYYRMLYLTRGLKVRNAFIVCLITFGTSFTTVLGATFFMAKLMEIIGGYFFWVIFVITLHTLYTSNNLSRRVVGRALFSAVLGLSGLCGNLENPNLPKNNLCCKKFFLLFFRALVLASEQIEEQLEELMRICNHEYQSNESCHHAINA
uniref:Uncharacterized protein n=1 Tax=Panagrolaimus superbus TaxID=310955 RepID=A0A914YNV6_9BILA